MSPRRVSNYVAAFIILSIAALSATAAEVDFVAVRGYANNQNFQQAELAINDNDARITDNDARIAMLETLVAELAATNQALQDQVNTLSTGIVPNLGDYVSVGTDENGYTAVFFDETNVYVRSGSKTLYTSNGLGNLILGYNTTWKDPNNDSYYTREPHCSHGYLEFLLLDIEMNQENCESRGYVWSDVHKSGSHNLVVGEGHNYSGSRNIVSGLNNAVAGDNAIVTGGRSLSGSSGAIVAGWDSEVTAAGFIGSGSNNKIHGMNGAIVGSDYSTVSAHGGAVFGGNSIVVRGDGGTALGGDENVVYGDDSTVVGGYQRRSRDQYNIVVGNIVEDQ